MFISYDDAHACQAKVSYARNLHLGGLMIWELSEDFFPTQPVGQRTPLISALKQALATPYFFPIAYYRLGENDPGAVTGQTANSTTANIVGGMNLSVLGTPPTYSADTASGAARSASL